MRAQPGAAAQPLASPHHPARSAIVLLGAALALALGASACSSSGDDASSPDTTAPAAASEPPEPASSSPSTEVVETTTLEVDGRNLYLACSGTGSPTVILQSGYGNAGDIWSVTDTASPAVFPAIATTNRVCTYDRPGSMVLTTETNGLVALTDEARPSRSDAAPMPRDPADVVTELHDLLAAAEVPGPYVLVGHSLGGALDRLYALTYPDEVRAMVIVDSPLPPSRQLLGPDLSDRAQLGPLDPSLVPGYQLEAYDINTLFDEIEAAGALPDIPVVIVRRGGPKMSDDPIPEGGPFTEAEIDAISSAQWEAQALWAASVPGAEVITVPDTTHYVQNQRPDVVVEAIRDVIARS